MSDIIFNIKKTNKPITRILVIRLQAMGDVLIILPYLQDLRNKLPKNIEIDLLTRDGMQSVAENLTIFNNIYIIGGERRTSKQFLSFLTIQPKLFIKHYDVCIDLQNHKLSNLIRQTLQIKTYALFDKYSSNYAGFRTQNTINALQLPKVEFTKITSFKKFNEHDLYAKLNLSIDEEYVVINPSGAFENRNWNLDNYVEFCELWLKKINNKTIFIILGLHTLKPKAENLKQKLGSSLIDLTGKTTFIEALHLLRNTTLVLSEDSGLMHAAYCVGTPTVAILGSTRSDWVNPNLNHTYFFTSSDLPCGDCMLWQCKFDEIKCLSRIKPIEVLNASIQLLNNQKANK